MTTVHGVAVHGSGMGESLLLLLVPFGGPPGTVASFSWGDFAVMALVGIAGAVFLHLFNRTVEDRFPSSYSALADAVEFFVMRTVLRHALFRLGPSYVVGVFVGVVVQRATHEEDAARTAILTTIGLHILATNVRAMWALRSRRRALERVLYHLIVLAALAGTAAVACLSYARFDRWVPAADELTVVLWTAVFAAVLSVAVQQLVSLPQPGTAALLAQANKDVGSPLVAKVRDLARQHGTDPDLLQAIVAVEALQRPRWFRRAERIKGAVFGSGSYGPAQMSSPKPISDEESLLLLARSFENYRPPFVGEERRLDAPRVAARIEEHNPDSTFSSLVLEIYDELVPLEVAGSRDRAADGRPIVEVLQVERRGSKWVLSGTANWSGSDRLRVRQQTNGSDTVQRVPLVGQASDRRTWEVAAPIEVDKLFIRPAGSPVVAGTRAVVEPTDFVGG